ncbi:MAG: hypothetical protein Q8K55_01450 [Gemmatimonadaceae bacterium]|nr:hypothetical protein [Gemmatimonadaceae bacterium]
MIRRHTVPLVIAALATVTVACMDATNPTSVPYGFVSFVAQQSGGGFTASPIGTFFGASGLGVPTAVSPWDSCRQQTYTRATVGLGEVYPNISAGEAIQIKVAGRTDTIFPSEVGREVQYRLRAGSIPYVPGDSVSVVIPGSADGYPAITFKAKSAEALMVTDFGTPTVGPRLDLRWNPGQDLNSTVAFSFRYGALDADTLNTQIYCQFRDDGADSIPAKYMGAWAQARTRAWVATRVRTYVAPVARNGYFDFISTFDVPTPPAP